MLQSVITSVVRSAMLYARGGIGIQEAVRRNANLTPFVWSVFTGLFFYAVVVMVFTAVRFRALYAAERVSALSASGSAG